MAKINNGCGGIKKSNSKEAEEKPREKSKEDQIKVFIGDQGDQPYSNSIWKGMG